MYSLSRTLVVRFSLTIFVALLLIALWAYLGTQRILQEHLPDIALAAATRPVLALMLGTVLLGTVATIFGASWLARVAVEPVERIAAQASSIQPGTTGNRITVHADVTEYSSLVTVLNKMLERLDRGLESERRIISNVAHDIRTPITTMRGEIEVALRGRRSVEECRRILQSLLEEVDHLSSINEALLLLARIEAGELTPEPVDTDLAAVLEAAVERVRGRSGARHITLRGEGEVCHEVDQRLIGTAVDQLLDNAARHTPADTEIVASVAADNGVVRIIVEDDGPGVSPETLPFLFDRLFRGDPARGRGGAGLGLTIARAIAEAHGGSICAELPNDGGFRITISLPKARAAVAVT